MHVGSVYCASVIIAKRTHHKEQVFPVDYVLLQLDTHVLKILKISYGIEPGYFVIGIHLHDFVKHVSKQDYNYIRAGNG